MDPHPDFAEIDLPRGFDLPSFRMTPLTAAQADEDFEVVTGSADVLKGTFGDWPEGLTYADDLTDLHWHDREFTCRRFVFLDRPRCGRHLSWLRISVSRTGCTRRGASRNVDPRYRRPGVPARHSECGNACLACSGSARQYPGDVNAVFVIRASVEQIENGGRPWNRTKRESPRGSYSPLPHLAACRPPGVHQEHVESR